MKRRKEKVVVRHNRRRIDDVYCSDETLAPRVKAMARIRDKKGLPYSNYSALVRHYLEAGLSNDNDLV